MIRKPSGVEQEDRLHAAVGTVIQTGAEVRAAGRTVHKAGRKVGLYYIFGMMGFGLLVSSTHSGSRGSSPPPVSGCSRCGRAGSQLRTRKATIDLR